MLQLLAMPEIWIATGLIGGTIYWFVRENRQSKQVKLRLARITQRKKHSATAAQSLRRKNPARETAFGQRLAEFSSVATLQGKLDSAGLTITVQRLLSWAGGLCAASFMLVTLLLGKSALIGLLLGIVIGVGGPYMLIRRRLRKRRLAFLKLFPDAIELMVRGLRAGLPVTESFYTVARELPAPMGDTFTTITQQIQLGMPLERSLVEAALRLDLTEFNFFVTTVILQRETGGNLSEILENLADMLRQRQIMKLKIRALSSEARASAMIVGSLPFLVFAALSIISPDYLDPLYDDYRGNMALIGVIGTLMFGSFVMYRMTQFEI